MTNPTRAEARGMTIGALVFAMFGAAWAFGAVLNRPGTPAWVLYIVTIPPLVLMILSALCFGGLKAIAPAADSERAAREGRAAGLMFGVVVAIEVVLIAGAAMALSKLGRPLLIPVCVVAIVGAHFLPLAKTFRIPLYTLTGWLLILVAAGSMLLPDEAYRDFVVGLVVAGILWACAGILLNDVRRATVRGKSARY